MINRGDEKCEYIIPYATTCDKMVEGGFSGGVIVVTAKGVGECTLEDQIEFARKLASL